MVNKYHWKWIPRKGYELDSLEDSYGLPIMDFGNCESYYNTAGTPPDEYYRNIIVAAPDLLEALIMVKETMFNCNYEDMTQLYKDKYDKINNAINKAYGK